MQLSEGYHTYYIYIITNKSKTVFYTGVTNNLGVRLNQHKENITGENKSFASKYNVEFLLFYEKFTWIQEAINREILCGASCEDSSFLGMTKIVDKKQIEIKKQPSLQ